MATKKFPADRMNDKSLGDINQKKNKWGGDGDVVKPYSDPKEKSKNSGVDTKVFNKDGTNEIPWIANAGNKESADSKNFTGKLFPEAGTSCVYDGGGMAKPVDAGKSKGK